MIATLLLSTLTFAFPPAIDKLPKKYKGENGGDIHGHLFAPDNKSTSSRTPFVVYAHDLGERSDEMWDLATETAKMNISGLTFDFTGHGESKVGKPWLSQTALEQSKSYVFLNRDIKDSINFMSKELKGSYVLVVSGKSLGVALFYATKDQDIKAILAIDPPSIEDFKKLSFNFEHYLAENSGLPIVAFLEKGKEKPFQALLNQTRKAGSEKILVRTYTSTDERTKSVRSEILKILK